MIVNPSPNPQEIRVRLTGRIGYTEALKREIYLPREPGVYDLRVDEAGLYAVIPWPTPEDQIGAAVRSVVSGAEGGAA